MKFKNLLFTLAFLATVALFVFGMVRLVDELQTLAAYSLGLQPGLTSHSTPPWQ